VIIAVDGPAASGKGTIARALAAHYRLPHLDTGLLYRAVGLGVLKSGGDPGNPAHAFRACHFADELLHDPAIRSEATGSAASMVSAHPEVRAALIERQRVFAAQPGGAVLDGRDIGTVIAPHADAKLYVTADATVRAQRRHDEAGRLGHPTAYDMVLADILARDDRDAKRASAPLRQADDADLLDTSSLSIDAAIAQAIALVERRLATI
jgi:cytidylate kinase